MGVSFSLMVVAALMVMIGESVVDAEIAAMSQEAKKERYLLKVWLCSDTIKENSLYFFSIHVLYLYTTREA